MAAIRVVLADDHSVVRFGIRAVLQMVQGVQVVGEAGNGADLVALTQEVAPDLVMADIDMPGMDGLTATSLIRDLCPGVRVLMLSMHRGEEYIARAIAAGANGYLEKDASHQELAQAIRRVMADQQWSVPERTLAAAQSACAREDGLTARQVEVLKLVAAGLGSREIALKLGLSAKTVDVHRGRVMARLQLSTVADLTRYAIRNGLINA